MELRPQVQKFAEAMERQLQLNDHKPGWKGDSPFGLLDRIDDEVLELKDAVTDAHRGRNPKGVLAEAADVANFCMMIADVQGEL